MKKKFPIWDVFERSMRMPLENLGKAFGGLVLLFGSVFFVALFIGVIVASSGADTANSEIMAQQIQNGNFEGLGSIFLLVAIVMLVMGLVVSHIFNHWVRLAAFGKENARYESPAQAFVHAFINTVKFTLIVFMLGFVTYLVYSILSFFDLGPSWVESLSYSNDSAGLAKRTLTASLILLVIHCFVYSVFSANLTRTALDSDKEGFDHPHTSDFAVVLMLIYGVHLLPTTAVALSTGSNGLTSLVSSVLGFYVLFAAAAAHGLRYRLCVGSDDE